MRISESARVEGLKKYLAACDRVVSHYERCPVCKTNERCPKWDELHEDYEFMEAQSKLLLEDRPQ